MNKAIVTTVGVALIGAASIPFIMSEDKDKKGSPSNSSTEKKLSSNHTENGKKTRGTSTGSTALNGSQTPKSGTTKTTPQDTSTITESIPAKPTLKQARAERKAKLHEMIETAIEEGGNKRAELKVRALPDRIVEALEVLYLFHNEFKELEEVENGHAPGEYDFESKGGKQKNFTLRLYKDENGNELVDIIYEGFKPQRVRPEEE